MPQPDECFCGRPEHNDLCAAVGQATLVCTKTIGVQEFPRKLAKLARPATTRLSASSHRPQAPHGPPSHRPQASYAGLARPRHGFPRKPRDACAGTWMPATWLGVQVAGSCVRQKGAQHKNAVRRHPTLAHAQATYAPRGYQGYVGPCRTTSQHTRFVGDATRHARPTASRSHVQGRKVAKPRLRRNLTNFLPGGERMPRPKASPKHATMCDKRPQTTLPACEGRADRYLSAVCMLSGPSPGHCAKRSAQRAFPPPARASMDWNADAGIPITVHKTRILTIGRQMRPSPPPRPKQCEHNAYLVLGPLNSSHKVKGRPRPMQPLCAMS